MCFMYLIGCRILLTLCTDFVQFSWESVLDGPTVVRPQRGFRLYIHSLGWPCFPRFNVWDTAGQEKFGGLRDGYYIQVSTHPHPAPFLPCQSAILRTIFVSPGPVCHHHVRRDQPRDLQERPSWSRSTSGLLASPSSTSSPSPSPSPSSPPPGRRSTRSRR